MVHAADAMVMGRPSHSHVAALWFRFIGFIVNPPSIQALTDAHQPGLSKPRTKRAAGHTKRQVRA
jgi:hypothetical protein